MARGGSSSVVAGNTGASNDTVIFDPRLHADPSQFRIGGFQGTLPSGPMLTTRDDDSTAPSTAVEGDVDSIPSNEQPTQTEKTEEDKARELREQRFQALLNSGALGTPTIDDHPPGKRFTMPVEKPKFL
ncbi:hypothetical protein BGX28_000201 [Mortierella sp. GBA30]|nr:hypothetical protein BGX28_000201 [Mortierella sp. GBA30]